MKRDWIFSALQWNEFARAIDLRLSCSVNKVNKKQRSRLSPIEIWRPLEARRDAKDRVKRRAKGKKEKATREGDREAEKGRKAGGARRVKKKVQQRCEVVEVREEVVE
jgi:hypothetical protein